MTRLFQWLRQNRYLITNAGSLVGTAVVNSGLGFLYWWLASRVYSQVAVGLASAFVSAMILLGSVAMLGFGTLLVGEMARRKGNELALINTAMVTILVASVIISAVFVVGTVTFTDNFDELVVDPGHFLLFTLGITLTSITLMLDHVLVGLLHGEVQLKRNLAASVIKVLLLGLLGLAVVDTDGMWIFAAWVVGMLVSIAIPVRYLLASYGRSTLVDWGLLREIGASALVHHWLNLALDVPIRAMPVIVTIVLSPVVNASFYIAWMIGGLLFFPVQSITFVLYAVGAGNADLLAEKMRQTLRLSLVIGVAGFCAAFLTADLLMGLFGAQYAAIATGALRIVSFSIFPLIIKDHFVAIHRIHQRPHYAARIITVGAGVELLFATMGGMVGGLTLLTTAWVVAITLQALYMAPTVFQTARFGKDTARAPEVVLNS
jgi:O-antigen/teichoic acid export membrane protein